MPGPKMRGGPFPGFSNDHFNYGLQMGADGGGQTQFPWDNPFQDPYQNGIQAAPMGTIGEAGMGMEPPQDMMGMPPDGGMGGPMGPGMDPGMQGMQGMPQGMPGMPTDSPQQNGFQGPSPYGVWGDQDLINDPAYGQAAQTQHPKWNRFLQYMNTPEAKDSMMLGLIMAQMHSNPQAALQLAVQFREHQAQRKHQAEQNQLQREQGEENIRLRSEYMKQQKEETKQRTLEYKIDQSRKDLANLGKDPGQIPDDPAAYESYFENLRNQLAAAQKEKTDVQKQDKARGKAFSESYKSGAIQDEFKDDPMVQAAAQVYNDRKLRADERFELQKTRMEQLNKITADKNLKPEVRMQAQAIDRKIKASDRFIARYEQNIANIEGGNLYPILPEGHPQRATFDKTIERYQAQIEKEEEKRTKLDEQWDELVTTRGEARPAPKGEGGYTPPPASAGGVKDTVAPPASTGAGGKAGPSEKAQNGFRFAYSKAENADVKKILVDEWKRQYNTEPPTE